MIYTTVPYHRAVTRAFDPTTGTLTCTIPSLFQNQIIDIPPWLKTPDDIVNITPSAAGYIERVFFDSTRDNGLYWIPQTTKGMTDAIAALQTSVGVNTGLDHETRIQGLEGDDFTARQRHGGKWRRAATQSLTTGVAANLQWDTEDEDTDGYASVASPTWTNRVAGIYMIQAQVSISTPPDPVATQYCRFVLAGSWAPFSSSGWGQIPNSGATVAVFSGFMNVPVALGDTLQIQCVQSSGATKTIANATLSTYWIRSY